jgi:hypothetical protein
MPGRSKRHRGDVRVGAIKLVVLERLVGEVGGYGTPDDAEDDPDDAPGPIVRDEEAYRWRPQGQNHRIGPLAGH